MIMELFYSGDGQLLIRSGRFTEVAPLLERGVGLECLELVRVIVGRLL
jgi:hypothetical protein